MRCNVSAWKAPDGAVATNGAKDTRGKSGSSDPNFDSVRSQTLVLARWYEQTSEHLVYQYC